MSAVIYLKKPLSKDGNGPLLQSPVQTAVGADIVKLVTKIHAL